MTEPCEPYPRSFEEALDEIQRLRTVDRAAKEWAETRRMYIETSYAIRHVQAFRTAEQALIAVLEGK